MARHPRRLRHHTVLVRRFDSEALGPPPLPLQPVSLDQALPCRGSGPSRRRTARSARPPATRQAHRSRPRTPRTPPRAGRSIGYRTRPPRELTAAPAHRHDIRIGAPRNWTAASRSVSFAELASTSMMLAPGTWRAPLHVERLLELPTARRIAGRITVPPVWSTRVTVGGGQPELGVECVQISLDVRVVVGIDDGDRLAPALARDATEGNIIKSICLLDLQACTPQRALRRRPRGGGSRTSGGRPASALC